MENNYDEEEKKFFTNGMILNRLGDTRDFGNFYELIYNRKLKVLSFLNKDIAQITNPDLRKYDCLGHAYDIFLSYHIFYPYLYEDHMFMNTLDTVNLQEDILKCIEEIKTYQETESRHGLVCELLLFHEKRKFKGDVVEEEVADKTFIKKRNLTRRNMVIRLKTTEDLIDEEKGIRISRHNLIFKLYE